MSERSFFVKSQMIARCSTQEIVVLFDKMEENRVKIETQLAEKDKEIERLNGLAERAYHEGWNDNRDNFGNSGDSFIGSDTKYQLEKINEAK